MVSKMWNLANWLNPFSPNPDGLNTFWLRALGCLGVLIWGGWFSFRLIPPIEEIPAISIYSPKIIPLDVETRFDWQSIQSLRLQSFTNRKAFSRKPSQSLKSRRDQEAEKQNLPRFHFRITGILADSAKPQGSVAHLTMRDGQSLWLRVGDTLPGRFSSWKIRSIRLGTIHVENEDLSDWIGVGQSRQLPGVSPTGLSGVETQARSDRSKTESVSSPK